VWHLDADHERPAIDTGLVPNDVLAELYSKSRRKTIRRNLKRLSSSGNVETRLTNDASVIRERATTFLELEAAGWKSDEGTALKCNADEREFFLDTVDAFAQRGNAIFVELLLDGKPIASTINLQSGQSVFAFKIGWNPEYAEFGPGTLVDYKLLANCRAELPDVKLIDSCAAPNSYLDSIWPWKQRVGSGLFAVSRRGKAISSTMMQLKLVKRGVAAAMQNV